MAIFLPAQVYLYSNSIYNINSIGKLLQGVEVIQYKYSVWLRWKFAIYIYLYIELC